MPDFANFTQAVLNQGEPRRVPQFDGTVAEDIKNQFLGKPSTTLDDEVQFMMQAGYDYVPLTIGMRQTMRGERQGIMGAKQLDTQVLKPLEARYNPRQEAKSTRMWAEEGVGLIHDEDSFDRFDWPDPDTGFSYDTLDELARLLPDGAKVIVNVGYVFSAPWMLMGLTEFCMGVAQKSPLVARMIERSGTIQHRVVENLLDYDCVGAIRMPDDLGHTGGTLVDPAFLRQHVFDWYERIGRLVHARGLPYLFHSDGRLYEVLDDLVACGYDALHPCEPASMDIDRLKHQYGGRLALMGNINLDSTLCLGTPDEVREETRLRIRAIAPGGGYCCGSSNSIPEYVPYENYLAMIETIQKHGKYPIS